MPRRLEWLRGPSPEEAQSEFDRKQGIHESAMEWVSGLIKSKFRVKDRNGKVTTIDRAYDQYGRLANAVDPKAFAARYWPAQGSPYETYLTRIREAQEALGVAKDQLEKSIPN